MKKVLLSIVSVVLAAVFLCSCGSAQETALFGTKSAKGYVKLGDYKKITINAESEEYKEHYNDLYHSDIAKNGLYDQVNEGEVQEKEYANIDFLGKIDGVAFDRGEGKGYDLLIGSGSFIDGFEEGLIGKKVGETVDLNLTFPENYQSADLAGKDVVFTVTINFRRVPQPIEKAYTGMGFDSLEKYKEDLNNRCKKFLVLKTFVGKCKVKSAPSSDSFKGLVMLAFYDEFLKQSQGVSLTAYLKNNGQTYNDFAANIIDHMDESQINTLTEFKTARNTVLTVYALSEELGFSASAKKLANKTEYEKSFAEYVDLKDQCTNYLLKNTTFTKQNKSSDK